MAIRDPIFFTAEDGSVILSSINYAAHIRDISITGGQRDVELLRAFGNKTFFIPRPQEPIEWQFTMLGSDNVQAVSFVFGGVYGGPAQDGSVYAGDGSRASINLEVNFNEPGAAGAAYKVAASGAYATSVEWNMATDNQLEVTLNLKSQPSQTYVAATPNRTTTPLK